MFDRKKLLLGAFSVTEACYTDAGVEDLVALGADYIVSVNADEAIVKLCAKHGLPMLVSGRFPSWWGGDGDDAGHYAKALPLEKMPEVAKNAIDDAIIAGDYLVDEPSSLDFAHINRVAKRYCELYPGKMPFVNLYPNYASVAQTSGEERVNQLGNPSYEEHVAQYMRKMELDYLCFDYYPFQRGNLCLPGYLRNLRVTAEACRDAGRDLWLIFQAGEWVAEEQIREFQLRWQCFLALAYGCKSLQAAAYCKAWWDPSTCCVNDAAEKNPMYGWVKRVYAELHALGDAYMGYRYVGTRRVGSVDGAHELLKSGLSETEPLEGDEVRCDGALIVGLFEKPGARAYMLVNCCNPCDESASVTAVLRAPVATVWRDGRAEAMRADANGEIALPLASGEGVLAELR